MSPLLQNSFSLDRNSSSPLHRQVEQWLRDQIESGNLASGEALPPRKEFCEMLGGINHLTVRQAVSALVREGLLVSVQGRGTFVTEKQLKQLRIGLVLPNLDDEFTHAVVEGIQGCFDHPDGGGAPVRTVLFDSRRDTAKEVDNIKQLQDLPLDGAIILPVSCDGIVEQLVRLRADHFPAVLLGWIPGIKFDSVTSDDYRGSYDITRHLLEKGRKHLAWIGNRNSVFSVADRLEGFRDAINDFGLSYDRKLLGELNTASATAPFESELIAVIQRLLEGGTRPDAIVCSNDLQALVCLRELQHRGWRIPQDISVVGFDDIREAATCQPSLTTVRNPMRQLGLEAAKLILRRIQSPDLPPQRVTLPVSLQLRQSS